MRHVTAPFRIYNNARPGKSHTNKGSAWTSQRRFEILILSALLVSEDRDDSQQKVNHRGCSGIARVR